MLVVSLLYRDFSRSILLTRERFKVHGSYFVDLSSDCVPELLVFVSNHDRESDNTHGFLLLSGVSSPHCL